MSENSKERRSRSQVRDVLPYNPDEWSRRLAEARERRAAALRQREVRQDAPSDRLAAAWEGERDILSAVTRPLAPTPTRHPATREPEPVSEAGEKRGPVPQRPERRDGPPKAVSAAPRRERAALSVVTRPPADRARRPGSRVAEPAPEARRPAAPRPWLALAAGCLIGAAMTGLVFLAAGAGWRADPAQRGAASATALDVVEAPAAAPTGPAPEPPAGPASPAPAPAEAAADPAAGTRRAAIADPDPAVGQARAGATPPRTAAPAPVAAQSPGPTPVYAARLLAVPDMVNAPQLQSPHDHLPAAPDSISRVVILAPKSVSRAGREEAAALLRETGWPARDPRTSPFTIRNTHVRYYHPGDREGAEQLAGLFSAEARDFTSYAPRPPEGRIELWLAGRAPQRAPERQAPSLGRFLSRLAAALEGRG